MTAIAQRDIKPAIERPILFKGRLVRAILAGAKTQTRRALRLPAWITDQAGAIDRLRYQLGRGEYPGLAKYVDGRPVRRFTCPYGAPGERLWVRETHAQFAVGNRTGDAPLCVAYRATCGEDGGFDYVHNGDEIMRLKVTKWTPAIHMPRWASRIDLEVTAVRVERLHDITEEDAHAEGVALGEGDTNATRRFFEGWREINGDESWDANPWVWVVSFRRVRP
jgi:hypothetical protein